MKSPLSQQGPAPCESCTQLQRQVTELQRLLLQTKAEKDEALKLKEEVKGLQQTESLCGMKNPTNSTLQ